MRACMLIVVVVLSAGLAHAGEPSQPVSPEAKRLVDAGVEHYNAGRYDEAIKEFELAYRLSGRPALLFNIARAEAKLGHDAEAVAFLRRYLEERPNAPDAPAVLAEIEAHEKAIADEKAKVEAEQEAAQASEEAHRAEHEAAEARHRATELSEAAARQRAADEELKRREQARARGATLRRAGIGLVVGGAVVVLTGVALGIVASQASDNVAGKSGVDFGQCCADLEQRGTVSTALGITFDVLGGVAVAAGAGLIGWSARVGRDGATHAWRSDGLALAASAP